jgi:hypothetical protein
LHDARRPDHRLASRDDSRARSMPRSGGGAVRRGILLEVTGGGRSGMGPAVAATVLGAALVLATYAGAADRPHYDVPSGYTSCPTAKVLEWVLQMGVRQAHDLPPRNRLHARLRQAGDPRRHAATPARLSVPDPVLAKRGRRRLRQPTQVRPPPRGDPLLRDGVGAHPRKGPRALDSLRGARPRELADAPDELIIHVAREAGELLAIRELADPEDLEA